MIPRLGKLRELLAPIPDEQLPQLGRTCDGALRILVPLLWICSLLFLAIQAVAADLSGWAVAFPALSTAIYPVIALAQLRRWMSSERLLFATGVWIVVSMSYEGLAGMHAYDDLLVYAGVTPTLLAAFIPWKPRFSLLLAVPNLAMLAIMIATGAQLPLSAPIMVSAAASAGIAAALSNQFHRRQLLALERAKDRLAASERMSSLGRLSASMAHELKTPIGATMTETEVLRRLVAELAESIGHEQVTEDDLREIATEMGESVDTMTSALARAGRYVAAVREHTVGDADRTVVTFTVESRVRTVVTLLAPVIRQAGVEVTTEVDPALEMTADPGKLDQILLNLLQNAVDALAPNGGGQVVIRVESRRDGRIVVSVIDDGPGVPDALGDKIFEPLFTTRLDGGGTGLGLAICRDIATTVFGGSLRRVSSTVGAHFELVCRDRRRDGDHGDTVGDEVWQPPQRHVVTDDDAPISVTRPRSVGPARRSDCVAPPVDRAAF